LNVKNDQRPLRILIVEDNTDIAENIGDYLEQQGHVLDFAMDGIGGLHLALTHDFDIIVLDIMLPGMDGLTFCRKLRKRRSGPAGGTNPSCPAVRSGSGSGYRKNAGSTRRT
jgi:CheY-like chemotaxis protein